MAEKKTPKAQQIVEILTPHVGKTLSQELFAQVKSLVATVSSGSRGSKTCIWLANKDGSQYKDEHGNGVAIALRDFYYQYPNSDKPGEEEVCWGLPADFGRGKVKAPQGVTLIAWNHKAQNKSDYSEMCEQGTRDWTRWYTDVKGRRAEAKTAFDNAFNDNAAMATPEGVKAAQKARAVQQAVEAEKPTPNLEDKPAGFMTEAQVKDVLRKANIPFVE